LSVPYLRVDVHYIRRRQVLQLMRISIKRRRGEKEKQGVEGRRRSRE
jgi:hypothetical protein